MDTADTGTFDGGDLDVSIKSPGSTPGVSDNVVVLSSLGSVTNSGDGVIEGGTASGGVEDTGGVSLEDGSIGLNGDGGWSLSDGSLKLLDGSGLDVSIGGDLSWGGLLVSAGSVSSSVGIVGLVLGEVGLQVVEGVGLPSTVATVGGGVAVNKLLLGEALELSGLDEMVSLNSADGGEGPA